MRLPRQHSGGGRERSCPCRRTQQFTTPRQRDVTPGSQCTTAAVEGGRDHTHVAGHRNAPPRGRDMSHPDREHQRTACAWGTNAIAHHGVPHIEGAALAAQRSAVGVSLEGKRLHSGSAVQGQRARRGGNARIGAAAQCRRMGVNDSTSARKVSCSGRAAQLVMWVYREAMKPACVCVVECLSGSVWRGGQCPAAIDS